MTAHVQAMGGLGSAARSVFFLEHLPAHLHPGLLQEAEMDHWRWYSEPLVQDHIALARTAARAALEDALTANQGDWMWGCESVTEAIFAVWWRTSMLLVKSPINLRPQHTIEANGRTYRIDFIVECSDAWLMNLARARGVRWSPIAVELDGHEFHERTLDQVTYRNQRDRDLQQRGVAVFHFSYDELTANPSRCVFEVISSGQDQVQKLREACEGTK